MPTSRTLFVVHLLGLFLYVLDAVPEMEQAGGLLLRRQAALAGLAASDREIRCVAHR
jgi:hypothetical protein